VHAPRWLWLAFGLLLGIKQYAILAAPLAPFLLPNRSGWRLVLKSAAVATFIVAPFFLWDPVAIFRSVVLWQFRQPFRTDSLSYAALAARTIGVQPGIWLSLLVCGGVIWLAFQRSPRNAFGFAMSLSLVLLVFFAFSKQAFCNYYFLVIGATCTAIALSEKVPEHAASQPLRVVTHSSEYNRPHVAHAA
jgi:hypothetical protein